MSDESTTAESVPEPPAPSTSAPAVQTDELWGGPRWIENAGPEPVWVETKQQYWDLLNHTGFTMKHQQESTTGPEREPQPWVAPPTAPADVMAPADFTSEEAEILWAYGAVLVRYGLVEALWCERCFERGAPHGMRAQVHRKRIRIECRCGVAEYRPIIGTTDQPFRFANTAKVMNDRTRGAVETAEGQKALPTDLLSRQEAKAIRQYAKLCRARHWDPLLYCRDCAETAADSTAMAIHVDHDQIVLTCQCRVLFYAGHSL